MRWAAPHPAVGSIPRVALLGLAIVTIGCGAEGNRPGITLFPDMMESVPHDTFESNPAAEAGIGMLLPPVGTVPVSGRPMLYGPAEEEAIRAGLELVNPLVATPENLALGKRQYESTCLVCHGPGGEGDGPIIGRFPNPASLLAEHARSYPDGRLYHVITHGQGIMPSHAVQVLPQDRWRLVLYLRQLQGEAPLQGEAELQGEAPLQGEAELQGEAPLQGEAQSPGEAQ